MHYLDASFAVTAFTSERATNAAQTWLQGDPDLVLVGSAWMITEFSSAMSIKTRRGELSPDDKAQVNAAWYDFCNSRLIQIAIAEADFYTAAQFADRHALNLRAGDALHIAIAARHGCTLVTLDRIMAAAAIECGVPVTEFDFG